MKPITIVGLVLVALGLVALVTQGLDYRSRDTIIDIGPLHATAERTRTLPLPPILGGLALASGLVLVVVGKRRGAG